MEFLKFLFLIHIFLPFAQAGEFSGLQFFEQNKSCSIKKDYQYLDKMNAEELGTRIAKRYQVSCLDRKLKAYLLSDKIRTHFQTIFLVLEKDTVLHMETFKFAEPVKYRSPQKWFKHFIYNKVLGKDKVDGITGATLTSQSLKRIIQKAKKLNEL